MDRELNRKILFVFIVCVISVVTVNWVISEKFISDARVAFFINIIVAIGIAFLFERYMEGKINRSIDSLMSKIKSVSKGDLTQRFKEDPEDVLPYGLSFELGEMMKSLRESVGGLWKISALLVKQLDLFIISTKEALEEFRSEVEYFSQIGGNLESVRSKTMEINKKFADLDVNTTSDLIAVEQVNKSNEKALVAMKGHKDLIHNISNDLEDFNIMTGNLENVLDDFFELLQHMSEIDKSMKSLSTESGLVKLNASIDAVQDQSNEDNYQELINETENLVKKISDIASSSSVSSTMVENKVAELSKKVKGAKDNIRRGLDDAVRVENLLDTVNGQSLEAASVYGTVFKKIKNLNTLMDDANVKRTEFSKTIKLSIDRFDKLKSDTQITLLKFNQLEEKIEGIKDNLNKLETFKNSFQIA